MAWHTTTSHAAEVMADSPVAWWPLGAGGSEPDSSGHGHTVGWTATPSAVDVTGFGGGVSAAGGSVAVSTVGSDLPGAVTLEAWVRLTTTGQVCIASARNSAEHWAVYHGTASWGGLLLVIASAAGLDARAIPLGTAVNDGELHHIAVEWGTTAVRLYLDGELAWSTAPTWGYSPSYAPTYLTVGGESSSTGSFIAARQWVGELAHVALYDRHLDAERWRAHYAPPPPAEGGSQGRLSADAHGPVTG